MTAKMSLPALTMSNSTTGRSSGCSSSSSQPFKLLITNAFGLLSKVGELRHALKVYAPDIAIVTETKLTQDKCTDSDVTFPGYFPPVRRDRTAHGGGVAIWIKTCLPYKDLQIDSADQEILWVSIALKDTNVGICALYRPGSCADTDITIFPVLEHGIEKARSSYNCGHIILAGDFNVHNEEWLGSTKTTAAGEAAEDLCYLHSLHQHVSEPTRGKNILDLVLTDLPGNVTTTVLAPLGRSDHATVIANLNLLPIRDQISSRTVWRYQQADWPRLRAFYRSTEWADVITADINRSCARLTDKIREGMSQFIPSKVLRTRTGDPSWWTPECTAAEKRKRKAWCLHRQHPGDPQLLNQLETATRASTACLSKAQSAHTSAIRRRVAAGSLSSRQWWTTVKNASGHGRNSDVPLLRDENGTEHKSSQQKADCFAKFFSNKCRISPDLCPDNLPDINKRSNSTLSTVRFRTSTVCRELRKLKPSKATGSDDIPGRVLKQCCDELSLPVSRLFTAAFRQGIQPALWKHARVVPVHKRKSKSDVKNYRPISLLPILSKIMEAIINRSLMNFLENNSILSPNQFGFRRGLSTQDALTLLNHRWSTITANGGAVRVVAVDIAGAFDRVSHIGLLHKLQQNGIQGHLLSWLGDYLKNRTLDVVINGKTSQTLPVEAGVPQGSILGPSLFLIYINDAEDTLPDGVHLAVYADDTTLFQFLHAKDQTATTTAHLQDGINALAHWGNNWAVTFEPSKSQAMVIAHHRQPWNFPQIVFDGIVVADEPSLKLLGVEFDSSLSYRKHIRQISARARQRLGLLKKASAILPPLHMEKAYKGFVRPLLEYCPLVWMGAADSHLQQLTNVQMKALKVIGETWLPSLALRRTVAACTYLYKLHHLADSSPLKSMLPPPAIRRPLDVRPTRQTTELQASHDFQLESGLPRKCRASASRSFPAGAVPFWNSLPRSLLDSQPLSRKMQAFKSGVYRHLLRSNWHWATDAR